MGTHIRGAWGRELVRRGLQSFQVLPLCGLQPHGLAAATPWPLPLCAVTCQQSL